MAAEEARRYLEARAGKLDESPRHEPKKTVYYDAEDQQDA